MATLEQLIIFFLLIGVGVIARKVGVITPGNTPQLTSLVFNFAMPAIILSGITTEQPHDAFARSEGGINTFGLTFAMQANKTADNSPSDTESGADKIVREASA